MVLTAVVFARLFISLQGKLQMEMTVPCGTFLVLLTLAQFVT